jgi:hypothetical protein
MATIDKLDINIYFDYAKRTQQREQISQQYHLEEAGSIPAQIRVIDIFPKPSEMILLLGPGIVKTPWSYFPEPPKYNYQRRSPFGFFRVAPSLGSFEKEEESEKELDEVICEDEEEEKEKSVLKNCFTQIKKINNWMSFIIGRVGQFLQG